MANEIRADLAVHGVEKAKRDFKTVGDAAAGAGDQVEDLGDSAKTTGEELGGLGKKSQETKIPLGELGAEVGFVDREIVRLTGHIADLAVEFDRTGDASLEKLIGKDQRRVRKLTKIGDLLPGPAEVTKAGAGWGVGLVEGASTWIKGPGGPILIGALAAVGVAAAPFLGSAVGAAVLGGVGGGGLIGGLALAARDPRVKAAAEEFGAAALGDLGADLGTPFVGPAMAGLKALGDTVNDVSEDLGPAFAGIAGEIGPLVKGIDGLARNAVPGLTKALGAAEPVIRTVGNHLDDLGAAVGGAGEDIADGADGATMALDVLLDGVEGTIITLGQLVKIFGETYESAIALADGIGQAADKTPDWLKNLFPLAYAMGGLNNAVEGQVDALGEANEAAPVFAGELANIGDAAGTAAEQIDAMQDAMNELFGITMDVNEATLGYEKAVDDLAAELADGAKTFDKGTDAGRRNWEAVNDQISAINDLRNANIENNMSVADANAIADQQLAKLDATIARFGATSKEVRNYIAEIRNVPTLAQLRIEVSGVNGAIAQLRALRGLLGSNVAAAAAVNGEYISGRASGGPVKAGVPYIVGEEGPELIVPGQSGTVVNALQTAAMRSGSSGGSAMGGGSTSVQLAWSGSMPAIMQALADTLTPYIQVTVINQGGIAQDTLGNGQAVT